MRVNGTDAVIVTPVKIPDSKFNSKDEMDTSQTTNPMTQNGNNLQKSEYEKKEQSIPEYLIIDAIEKANKAISISNRRFEYSIHEKTREIMVKVIDADTDEIIREIPPEKVLDMVARMWEMAGLIVDERR